VGTLEKSQTPVAAFAQKSLALKDGPPEAGLELDRTYWA
jgi:hypothetical protein